MTLTPWDIAVEVSFKKEDKAKVDDAKEVLWVSGYPAIPFYGMGTRADEDDLDVFIFSPHTMPVLEK